jgi:hypothetical protein
MKQPRFFSCDAVPRQIVSSAMPQVYQIQGARQVLVGRDSVEPKTRTARQSLALP